MYVVKYHKHDTYAHQKTFYCAADAVAWIEMAEYKGFEVIEIVKPVPITRAELRDDMWKEV